MTIEIDRVEIKFCPYCGGGVSHSYYEREGDDLHYRCRIHVVKCSKCKKEW